MAIVNPPYTLTEKAKELLQRIEELRPQGRSIWRPKVAINDDVFVKIGDTTICRGGA